MNNPQLYLLDSDVFIAAKNSYYAFAICPGFWNSLIHHYESGSVFSIDKVKSELLAGRPDEDLVQWVKNNLPDGFFLGSDSIDVTNAFSEIMLWVQLNTQFSVQAKAKFATEADGWLVAYANANRYTVVTNEQPRPDSKSRILLPDVCVQFNVTYVNTFEMLKQLAVSYELQVPDREP